MAKERSRPSSERDRLFARGNKIYRQYVSAEIILGQMTAEALGLNATDLFALNILALEEQMPAGELSTRTGLTTGATTRLIDRLEQAGFVERIEDSKDRRRVIVRNSPSQEDTVLKVLGRGRNRMTKLFRRYSTAKLLVLINFFAEATPVLLSACKDVQRVSKGAG